MGEYLPIGKNVKNRCSSMHHVVGSGGGWSRGYHVSNSRGRQVGAHCCYGIVAVGSMVMRVVAASGMDYMVLKVLYSEFL